MALQKYNVDALLKEQFKRMEGQSMRDMFEHDPERFSRFSVQGPELFLDYSKNLIDQKVLDVLFELAEEAGLRKSIDSMFAGESINITEDRPALHVALRGSVDDSVVIEGVQLRDEVQQVQKQLYAFVEAIHQSKHSGFSGRPIDTLVSIGIGGSYLGPLLVNQALSPRQLPGFQTHFVANIDPTDLTQVLGQVDPETTLFLVQSKSFGTLETLENAQAAKQWLLNKGASEHDITKHFAAVSANVQAAVAFGIQPDRVFPMWDWVGGRYSLWSAIGLPILFQFGREVFETLLDGAHQMDHHFRTTGFDQNLPVLMALIGVWYNNYFEAHSHAVLPYEQYLEYLPAYLQQLDMESNGKSVAKDGSEVPYHTGPVIWGGVGCNGQHAYHQLLHQGTQMIPVDFIVSLESAHKIADHHSHLFANCLGQSQAMMRGKNESEAFQELIIKGLSEREASTLAPHKVIAGNKPSNTLILERLDPRTLGSLIALYEHKVFVQGIIWNINSFDQWGVELGKTLESDIYQVLKEGVSAHSGPENKLDSSTSGLIEKYRSAIKS